MLSSPSESEVPIVTLAHTMHKVIRYKVLHTGKNQLIQASTFMKTLITTLALSLFKLESSETIGYHLGKVYAKFEQHFASQCEVKTSFCEFYNILDCLSVKFERDSVRFREIV